MTDCSRPDISELLVKYVWPEEFPEDLEQIEEHLRECPRCREELEMLRNLHESMSEHRAELADAVSPCPSDDELTAFALGETSDPSIKRHAECCYPCRTAIEIAREVSRSEPVPEKAEGLTAEERILISNAVEREYGEQPRIEQQSVFDRVRSFFQTFRIPSLAVGAVATALLVVAVLVPWSGKEPLPRLILGDARWETSAPQSMMKGGDLFTHPRKVAVIILLEDEAGLTAEQIREMYGKINLERSAGNRYEFLSPVDVKKAMAAVSGKPMDVREAAAKVFEKTDADSVLAFRIARAGSNLKVTASLYQRSKNRPLGAASRDGVTKDRLAETVTRMAKGLLTAAE